MLGPLGATHGLPSQLLQQHTAFGTLDDASLSAQAAPQRLLEAPEFSRQGGLASSLAKPVAEARSASVEDSLSISLTTQEGDQVTIFFESASAFSASSDASGYSVSAEQSLSAGYSVVGDLNAEELAAIDRVVASAAELSQRFFDGDLTAPAQALAALDFDANQLSQFSLDLARVERAEVTQYFAQPAQQLEQLGRGNDAIGSLLANLGEAQQRFIETLAETFEPQSAVAFNAELIPALIEPSLRLG